MAVDIALKCIKQDPLKLYILKRLNFMYICWSKGTPCEVRPLLARLLFTV